jgi:hypothetical protein
MLYVSVSAFNLNYHDRVPAGESEMVSNGSVGGESLFRDAKTLHHTSEFGGV